MLHYLCADIRQISKLGAVDFARNIAASRIRKMKLIGSTSAMLSVLSAYLFPNLSKLSLYVTEGPTLDPLGQKQPGTITPRLSPPAIRTLKYFSPSQVSDELLKAVSSKAHITRVHLPNCYPRRTGIDSDQIPQTFPLPLRSPKELCIAVPRQCDICSSGYFTRLDLTATELLDIRPGIASQSTSLKASGFEDAILAPILKAITVSAELGLVPSSVDSCFGPIFDLFQRLAAPLLQSISLQTMKAGQEHLVMYFNPGSSSLEKDKISMPKAGSFKIGWGTIYPRCPIGSKDLHHEILDNVKIVIMEFDDIDWIPFLPGDGAVTPLGFLRQLGDPLFHPQGKISGMKCLPLLHTLRIAMGSKMDTGGVERLNANTLELVEQRRRCGYPLESVSIIDVGGRSILEIATE
jgi:hypothetical protein